MWTDPDNISVIGQYCWTGNAHRPSFTGRLHCAPFRRGSKCGMCNTSYARQLRLEIFLSTSRSCSTPATARVTVEAHKVVMRA